MAKRATAGKGSTHSNAPGPLSHLAPSAKQSLATHSTCNLSHVCAMTSPQLQMQLQFAPSHNCSSRARFGLVHASREQVLELQRRNSGSLAQLKCPVCQGLGEVLCKDCLGSGKLGRGGYNKKNRVDMARILDSKWTAMQTTLGWRHFRVIQQRKQAGVVFVQMEASCDPNTRLWVNAQALKDRTIWGAGWLQKSEIEENVEGGSAAGSRPCRTCSTTGKCSCSRCNGEGIVPDADGNSA